MHFNTNYAPEDGNLSSWLLYGVLASIVLIAAPILYHHFISPSAVAKREAIAECKRLVMALIDTLKQGGDPQALEYHKRIVLLMTRHRFNTCVFGIPGQRRLDWLVFNSFCRYVERLEDHSPGFPGRTEVLADLKAQASQFFDDNLEIKTADQDKIPMTPDESWG